MATVYVNDKPVDIGDARMNCIQAADRAGVFIPYYCWHPALTVVASCRMCLVEVGDRKPDGTIAMQPKVQPACQTPVRDGTVIVTGEYDKREHNSPPLAYPASYGKPGDRAKRAEADTLEGLLLNHPLDCPVCDKAGECLLQDYSYGYGRATSRMIDEKRTPPNKPDISSKITLFTDRCIMCSRCVRFTREISGTAELTIFNRGDHAEIDVFPGEPLENKLSGNVVDLCPVGALGSKDFLYKQRVWFLKDTDSVCPNCSTGCSIHVDTNKNVVFRLRPRENPQSQGYFMCDEGRWGYHYVNDKDRLKRPLVRRDSQKPASWLDTIPSIKSQFADAVERGRTVAVLSPFLTVEEAFLAAKFFKGLGDVTLTLGIVPIVGADDHYPKDRRGNPVQPTKFTIRAEKCPNRNGVTAILKHFQDEVISIDDAIKSPMEALWLTTGYPRGTGYPLTESPYTADFAERAADIPLVIVHELFDSLIARKANFVLPCAAWTEKDGAFVNHAGLAQPLAKASFAPGEARTEGQVFSELLGRFGLFRAASIREEIVTEMPEFAGLPLAPETGLKLELPVV
jgi:NADH-quinone oxidoreductase subunit G